MIETAPRMSRVKPSPSVMASRRARELKAAGRDVIQLTSGDPDFPTPDHIKEAAIRALERNQTRYTNVDGMPELKEAIQHKFKNENGLDYSRDRIMVGTGAKQIIYNALMASVGPEDEVIIPAPYWVSYPDMVKLAAGTPVIVACPQNNGFKLRPEDLDDAITPRTKWLILNSPCNPSGAVYEPRELEALAEVLGRHPHVGVITDDIYEYLLFDGAECRTIAAVAPELQERTLTVNGVSKAYAMTGWRIGYAGGPAPLIKAMTAIQSQSTSSPSSIGQAAAVEALNGPKDFLRERLTLLRERRDLIVGLLNKAHGLSCGSPQGAIYVYPSCAGVIGKKTPGGEMIGSDGDFTLYLLDHADVAVVQGEAYGLSPHLRIEFSGKTENLRVAGERIIAACAALR